MSGEVMIAFAGVILSGLLGIAGGVYGARAQSRQAREEYERTKKDELDAVIARYSEPLLAAAFELQSRLYNILRLSFVPLYLNSKDPAEREYARHSTLWLLGTYLGWVELLRRDLEHLNLGDEARSRELQGRLFAIRHALRRDDLGGPIRIFHAHQRALGEVMIAADEEGAGRRCLGYAAFCERLSEDERFADWFAPVRAGVEALAGEPRPDQARLEILQGELVALVDLLDPQFLRYPKSERRALATGGSA